MIMRAAKVMREEEHGGGRGGGDGGEVQPAMGVSLMQPWMRRGQVCSGKGLGAVGGGEEGWGTRHEGEESC